MELSPVAATIEITTAIEIIISVVVVILLVVVTDPPSPSSIKIIIMSYYVSPCVHTCNSFIVKTGLRVR